MRLDGYTEKFSAKEKCLHDPFPPNFHQVLFEKHNLNDGEHKGEITLLGDGWFIFQGVEWKRNDLFEK
jgi:hypothetical protein